MATNNICIDAQTLSSVVAGVVSQILQTRPGAQPLQSPAPNHHHHAISTENNLTPMQLFVGGFTLLTQQNPDGAACSPGASTGSSGVSNLATPAISSTPIVTVAVPHMLFLPCAGLQQSYSKSIHLHIVITLDLIFISKQ